MDIGSKHSVPVPSKKRDLPSGHFTGVIYEKVCGRFKRAIDNITPKVANMSIEELRKSCILRDDDYDLKNNLWAEVERAKQLLIPIDEERVYTGVCSSRCFYEKYLKNKKKLAWLLIPPAAYVSLANGILLQAMDKLKDAMNMPLKDARGVYDTAKVKLFFDIYKRFEDRVHGPIVKQIEKKSMSINIGHKTADGKPIDVKELDRQLKELEGQVGGHS